MAAGLAQPSSRALAQGLALEVRVTSAGMPVAGAAVTVRPQQDTLRSRTASTDASGRVLFGGLAAGRYRVDVERLGYDRVQREVTTAAPVSRLDIVLRERAVGLPGLVVQAERRRARFEESAGMTTAELSQREMKLLPAFGEADVLRAVEVLPGVVSTSDFSSSFNVRGGGADQNLILLDGLPIFNPFHLGGLFSVFNADMVARTELLAGGFPARYGGRVASVLEVESDPGGTGFDVQAGVSVLATRVAVGFDLPAAMVEGAGLSSARTRVSVRRSYFDKLLKPLFDFPYHLTDVQLFGEAWTPRGSRVTLSGYTGRDVLDLAGLDSFPLRVRWQWGNDVIGGSWTLPLGNGRQLDLRLGHTRFNTAIVFPDFGDTEFSSRIDQSLLRAEYATRAQGVEVMTGAAVDFIDYSNRAETGGTTFAAAADRGYMLGGFVQGRWRPERWILEAGLRTDAWLPRSAGAELVVQPRLALKRFLSDDVAIRMAVGRYAQFMHSLRDEELPLGIDVWMVSGERAPVVVSDQAQLGVEAFLGSGWFAALEGYYRHFDGVAANNTAEDPDDPLDDLLRGTGVSYGVDLQLRRDRGRVRPMIAVSLLRTRRTFEDTSTGAEPPPLLEYPPIFDRRVDIDFVLQALLPRGLELGVRWNFGTGLPYTRPLGTYLMYDYSSRDGVWRTPAATGDSTRAVVLGRRNAERYPVYHRLDAGVRRTFTRSWGTITPFLDVLNVYDKRNVLFYFFELDRTPPTRSGISMFPLLPTVGLEVRF